MCVSCVQNQGITVPAVENYSYSASKVAFSLSLCFFFCLRYTGGLCCGLLHVIVLRLKIVKTPVRQAAVHHMTRVLAARLASTHVLVNAIAAGPFYTKMMAGTLAKFMDAIVENVPLKRIGRPTDVGALCLFLASPGGSFVTGAVIPCDGGIHIGKPSL